MANDKSESGFSRTTVTQKFVINGKEYASLEDMPADIRARYEKLMDGMSRDDNGNGIPDMFETGGAFPNLERMMKMAGPLAMKSFTVGGGLNGAGQKSGVSTPDVQDIRQAVKEELFSQAFEPKRGGEGGKPSMQTPSVRVRENGRGSPWNWVIPLAVIAGILWAVFTR